MAPTPTDSGLPLHGHVFLGDAHARNERRTWAVITLSGAMMLAEIGGGLLFGSVALVADGLHMSTHAGALLMAALAYTYARRHAEDARFTFGTGKLGDLAGYTSAIVLAMIALLIGEQAVARLFAPVPIHYPEAVAIAAVGLAVNLASAWLLGGTEHHHDDHHHHHADHDNNLRAAFVHVAADAAVSVLVIVGLSLAWAFGWSWMDPAAGIVGALVIANWSWGLVRTTGGILLDMTPDRGLEKELRETIEGEGAVGRSARTWRTSTS